MKKIYRWCLFITLAGGYSLVYSETISLSSSTLSLALSVNNPNKNMALSGKPRTFIIYNKSLSTAENVRYTLSMNFPQDASITPKTCGNIAPHSHCIITIKPGSTPSSAPGMTSMPVNLTIQGNNTNPLMLKFSILDYGSLYQQGWVFAIDDTPSERRSIAGKLAALQDNIHSPNIWSQDNVLVTGIDETSTNELPSPPNHPGVIGCEGALNGMCNSHHIMMQDLQNKATNLCADYTIDEAGHSPCQPGKICYKNWYLPAICEMGYDTFGIGTGCGTLENPRTQNMELNLVYNDIPHVNLTGYYWSATEVSGGTQQNYAWFQVFSPNFLAAEQLFDVKQTSFFIRCVRAF